MTTSNKNLRRAEDVLEKLVGPFTFAMFMRGMRTTLDLSQVEMAKRLGISRQALCEIESGRTLVTLHSAVKYAKAVGFPIIAAVEASIQDQLRKAGIIDYGVKLVKKSKTR